MINLNNDDELRSWQVKATCQAIYLLLYMQYLNLLQNSTKNKLPNSTVRKQSQCVNNLPKAKPKKTQRAFIFFPPHWNVSYHHSSTLDLGTKRSDACEKYYAIIAKQSFFLDINTNFDSLLEILLLLIVQTKVGKNVSIFTDKKFKKLIHHFGDMYYLLDIPFLLVFVACVFLNRILPFS